MRLYRETRGVGPAITLLHGWAMNLRVFDALADALAHSHQVTTIDLPGHGRSPWRAGLSPGAAAEWLLEELPERGALLGWSLGGQLALRIAARAPARIERLVLVASTPRFTAGEDWPHGLEPAALQRLATDLAREPARTLAQFLELQVRGGAAAAATLATLQGALAGHGAAQAGALTAGLDWLASEDLRPLADALRLPVLLVSAHGDRVTPPGAARALAALLGNARLVELRRAAHALFLSHQAALLAELRNFLAPAGAGGVNA
ncbi:MAG: alpha/beta fold hydrolase [Gammaproteobacteria bacterium]|nr:alpha/beta fold hydrolase [Gammaproteobacteria bacterium]